MPITVKDIHEKEFSRQARGYNTDEVDDFLDEIANQLETLIRENRALHKHIEEGAVAEVPVQVVSAPVQVIPAPLSIKEEPVVEASPVQAQTGSLGTTPLVGDETMYFKNLEVTLRETLISAQRIADETVADARKKASQMVLGAEEKASLLVANAEEQAKAILATSQVEAESIRVENAEIRKAAEEYRTRFLRIVEDQMHVLKADKTMFE